MADRSTKTVSMAAEDDDALEAGRSVCPLFGVCGGCSTLHLPDLVYEAAKVARLVDAFAARNLFPEVQPLRRAPLASRRRATLTAVADGNGTRIGFQEARSHTVVDVPACPALAPPLADSLPAVREIAAEIAASAGRVRVVATLCHNGIDVAVTRDNPPPSRRAGKRRPRSKAPPPPPPVSADTSIIRLSMDGEPVFQRDAPVVRFDDVDVPFPPAAFLQASLYGEAALQQLVLAAAEGADVVLDAFCGLGTFAIPLTRFARVTAVEVDTDALSALTTGHAGTRGRRPVATLKRNLMGHPLGTAELQGYDVAVFDPPRAGAEGLARALAASAIPRVIAVSCEPVTLARDCAILAEGGYTITQVHPVDQFVGTDHLEAVVVMERIG